MGRINRVNTRFRSRECLVLYGAHCKTWQYHQKFIYLYRAFISEGLDSLNIILSGDQVKSMGEHLAKMERMTMPRKARFSTQFTDDITTLFTMVTRDIMDRYFQVKLNGLMRIYFVSCQLDTIAVFNSKSYKFCSLQALQA